MTKDEIVQAVFDLMKNIRPPVDYVETCGCKSCAAYRKLLVEMQEKEDEDLDPAGHY